VATRDAGGATIEALAESVPTLVGGSADLDPSTRTMMKRKGDFESGAEPEDTQTPLTQGAAGGVWGYAGRNIHFGIREHAMTAILTGMAHHGGVIPFGATFLTFSDYMRPSIRLAALSAAHVIYVWTHDSIALGEDGPTHQPVEQLASLRAMPNMLVLRPADANETVEAWRIAMQHRAGPVGLVLTRQKVPVLDRTTLAPAAGTAHGAYVLVDEGEGLPELILIATGSEVSLALDAHRQLAGEGIRSRVVSMPSWELFEAQPAEYRQAVLPPAVHARISVEAGAPFGWERYVGPGGAIIGVDGFGTSAPGPEVMTRYGFTVEHVIATAKAVLAR
jgi:transketolase